MSSFSPHFVQSVIADIFPSLRKTQKVNLALGVFGLIKSQSGIFSEIVREVPGAVKHKHRLKRFWRFVSNHRVKPERLAGLWVLWCVKTFTPSRYIPVAIDWTSLPGNLPCLMAAVPFHGRAIPLLWQIVPYRDIKDSQNRIEERLVARLVNLIPEDKRIILIGDRGFGRASFIQFLLKKQLLFVLRVTADVFITTRKGKQSCLRKLPLKPNKPRWFTKIVYRSDDAVAGINLAAVVAEDSDDPWFLVTNLRKAKTTINRYESRFQIEEWFRDLKHELGITRLRTKSLKRIRRMVFISVIAAGFLLLIGSLADRFSSWRDQLISGGKRSCSRVWFALRLINHQLTKATFWKRVWVRARNGP